MRPAPDRWTISSSLPQQACWAALLCLGLCGPARLVAVTVTSSTIQIQGDDRYDLYFNGVYISPHTDPTECFFDSPFYCKQVPMTWTIPAGLIDCGDNVRTSAL